MDTIRRRAANPVVVGAALAFAVAAGDARAAGEPPNPLLEPRRLTALRIAGPIRIDGVLDEPAWAAAPVAEQFMQERPAPGEPSRLHTSFRVVFDDAALYVGVRLDDPAAWAIQAPVGRRDDENASDWCFVEIDSRRDRRTAFSLGVNPAGVQVDGMFLGDVTYDASWNGVWEAATRVDAGGWTAEYRIPYALLAFQLPPAGEPLRWGINVYRHNPRTGESSNWSPRMPALAGVVSLFNELVIDAAPEVRRLDVTPYALVQAARGVPGTRPGTRPDLRAGLDANLGLTSGTALSVTVLPDFGQVEADPTQLNLTTFELFQQERRPFFTEGLDAFRFDTSLALVSRDDSFADEAAFYSRRIGRPPEGDVPAGAHAPLATDILGAAKLFGRAASGWRAGVLAAATGAAGATGPAGDTRVAAPTAAAIARVVREAGAGDAELGMFASGLHRAVDGALADQLPRDAGAVGIDGRIRWDDQRYEARGWALATDQLGSAAAIARLAAAPWHNLLRVDAPRLRLSDGATRLSGIAGEARLAQVGGALHWLVAARAMSPGFDVNGLGFQRNSDWLLLAGQWSYDQYVQTSWLRRWQVGSDNAGVGWSWGGERRAAVVDGFLSLVFANYWDATLTAQHELAALSTEWLRGGPALALPPREQARLSIHSDTRRTSLAGLDAAVMTEPGSGSRSAALSPSLTLRLSDHIAGTLGATYQDQTVGWQLVASPGGPAAAPDGSYLVGRLHQRTLSLSLRADLAISPRLILQLYAQPFATVGRYDRYARLADPRAARPDDRFTALSTELTGDATTLTFPGMPGFSIARPDGAGRSLIANAVARWELAPGSFLTAVWSHRGDAAETTTTARLAGELDRAAREPGSDTVLVKLGWRWAP
ncbi:MAG TPA: DUF5916 domain-containing protein [Kofleriaceae bacterium]|nr:DUF5916 domain-containing protein [Kofleriaceae bacterium]